MLNPDLLKSALQALKFKPNIDLFPSRINKQLDKYVTFLPDPDAFAVDAFSINWSHYKFVAFPPFALVSRTLQKIQEDQATGVVVEPYWPNQVYYPVLIEMLIDNPVILTARNNLLQLPSTPYKTHRLYKHLKMLVCRVSGCNMKITAFQKTLSMSLSHHGDLTPGKYTQPRSANGRNLQLRGIHIPHRRL
ncbi:reverse transcriptase [Elysia marginata]|uniref:Reverse transcriptase n=1 Tax=Elysia marginata TaxID=1093978 RepID=A0AAV4GIJ9_9GAST|nr:reverse transcriptase [Elysia marginata]